MVINAAAVSKLKHSKPSRKKFCLNNRRWGLIFLRRAAAVTGPERLEDFADGLLADFWLFIGAF